MTRPEAAEVIRADLEAWEGVNTRRAAALRVVLEALGRVGKLEAALRELRAPKCNCYDCKQDRERRVNALLAEPAKEEKP